MLIRFSKRYPVPGLMEQTLSPTEAGRRLGLSAERVRQLVRAGTLPSIPTPLGHLIRREDVDELAEARRQQRAQEKAAS